VPCVGHLKITGPHLQKGGFMKSKAQVKTSSEGRRGQKNYEHGNDYAYQEIIEKPNTVAKGVSRNRMERSPPQKESVKEFQLWGRTILSGERFRKKDDWAPELLKEKRKITGHPEQKWEKKLTKEEALNKKGERAKSGGDRSHK